MEMPVIVGIILAIIFLIVFSEWFYHMFAGWREIVIDDKFFNLRIVGASIVSILVLVISFVGMAYVTECPREEKPEIFERLNCEAYNKIKVNF